jgi:hypothetical protein
MHLSECRLLLQQFDLEVPMLVPLAFLLAASGAPAPSAAHLDDPPIRVKLSDESYSRGDRAKVKVRAAEDGYLLVLRVDTDGRLRVLYPLVPEDEGRIEGRKDFEVRSRGDREAFVVDDAPGSGMVLAAWSEQPFRFDDFSRNGHWDYRALTAEKITGDKEAGLLDLVDRMSDGKYQYDTSDYVVDEPGYVRHYSGWYDPWWSGYYPCFGCSPWYYGPRFSVGIGFGFGHGHFRRGRRW